MKVFFMVVIFLITGFENYAQAPVNFRDTLRIRLSLSAQQVVQVDTINIRARRKIMSLSTSLSAALRKKSIDSAVKAQSEQLRTVFNSSQVTMYQSVLAQQAQIISQHAIIRSGKKN